MSRGMEAINSGPMINKLVAAADRINAPSSLAYNQSGNISEIFGTCKFVW
jgi:hypothetical protein